MTVAPAPQHTAAPEEEALPMAGRNLAAPPISRVASSCCVVAAGKPSVPYQAEMVSKGSESGGDIGPRCTRERG